MRKLLLFSICSWSVILCFSHAASASDFHFQVGSNTKVNVSLELTPPVERWERGDDHTYFGNGYQLIFNEVIVKGRTELKVKLLRVDRQHFTLEDFRVTWDLKAADFFAIWTFNQYPGLHKNYRALSSESFYDLTSANEGIPYALAATREGRNLLAVGILSQDRTIDLQGYPQEAHTYRISLKSHLPEQITAFNEAIFTETTPDNWFKVTQSYAAWVDELLQFQPFPISPACYYPLYDVWYWAYDQTSIDLYWQTLVHAKNLGFRSYLFDAGWEADSGYFGRWLEGPIGNYFNPEDKLPGFVDFLRRVKEELKMNVILWMAPYAIGRESLYYPPMREAHSLFSIDKSWYRGADETPPMTLPMDAQFNENVNLCPRYPATSDYMRSLFGRVSQTYRPDGYWLDFQETIPFLCEATHEHGHSFGEGFNACQTNIRETVLQHNPQATVELRFPIANLNNKRHSNLWQSIDFPEDFDAMRLCSLMMRPFSRGVVMATDEMYWPPETDDTTVAKFVSTTIFSGVPAFGANFLQAPASHSQIVKAWLDFYKAHQWALTRGEFEPVGDFVQPDQKIESPRKAFIYLRFGKPGEIVLNGKPQVIFISNCTEEDRISLWLKGLVEGKYRIQTLDPYLKPISNRVVNLNKEVQIQEFVPQGGMLQLIRDDSEPHLYDVSLPFY